jgi:hypothetical protein
VNCVLVAFKKSVISIDPAYKVTCAVRLPLHPGMGSFPICTWCNSFSFGPNQSLEIAFCQCTSVSQTFILVGLQRLLKLLFICIISFHAFLPDFPTRQNSSLSKITPYLLQRPNPITTQNLNSVDLNSLTHAPASHALSTYPFYKTPSGPSFRIQTPCNERSSLPGNASFRVVFDHLLF